MMRSIFLKTLYDRRAFIIGWFIGMLALAALMTSFFPAFQAEGGIEVLAEGVPPAFEGLIGDLASLKTFDTYIASQLFDIRVPLIGGVMAIILGLALSTKEESDGELRTVLALPISRSSLLFQKFLAMLVIIAIITLGLALGVYAVLPSLSDASIETALMIKLLAMTWLVMVTFGTITYAVGMMSGRKAIANAIAIVAIIGGFLLTTFSSAVEWLQKYEFLSVLHYFPAVEIVTSGVAKKDVAVLILICLLLMIVALVVFRKRDIN